MIIFVIVNLLSSISDTIYPKNWYYLGPFSVGAHEGIIGVIDYDKNFIPNEEIEYPSILPQGGKVKWQKAEIDSEGNVELKYENVWWDTLQDIYGVAGTIYGTYVWSKFNSKEEGRALAIITGTGSFILNGKKYIAGICRRIEESLETPVVINKGENIIFFAIGSNKFNIKFIPTSSIINIINIKHEAILPDIILNEDFTGWGAISLINTTQEKMNKIKIVVGGNEYFKLYEKEINNIHPLCVKKEKIKIETNKKIDEKKDLWLPIKIYTNNEIYNDSLKLEVKSRDEPYRITFISKIDNSVQYFGIREPKDFDKNRKYALILSLHGAGIIAIDLIGCYEQKDWAFVVAPTNRGPLGFDWEDWGLIDAFEVLNEVIKKFPIDTNKIYLTGHSMGGHGVWNIGLKYPDVFAAIAPSAGWATRKIYIPWTFQKSELFAHPSLLAVKDMVLREHNLLSILINAKNLPIFILHGAGDDNVPPIHARLFFRYLEHKNVEFMEVEGKKHWWDEEIENCGVACVDHPKLMNFLNSYTRNPYPKEIYFKIANIATNNKCYWLTIEEQDVLYKDSEVQAKISNDTIFINTKNISALSVNIPLRSVTFIIDEQKITYKGVEPKVYFYKDKNIWKIGKKKPKELYKTKELHGPIKQAYFSPFIIVYGTKGDSLSNEIIYENAKFHQWKWWRRANSSIEILPDTEVVDSIIKNYNIILFGGPNSNALTKKVNNHLPIYIKDNFVYIGNNKINKKNIAIELIYPNPLNNKKFIVLYAGSDIEGEKISNFFEAIHSASAVPDFIIYDKGVKKFGFSAVLATGFFNKEWKLDPSLYYTNFQ